MYMCTKKEVLIFLAGAEAFHTLGHIVLSTSGLLPLHIAWLPWTFTPQLNIAAIAVNALITISLLYWASTLKTKKR